MRKRRVKRKIQRLPPRPGINAVKVKKKKKPVTIKDILLAIFALIMLIATLLFIYQHVKLFFK